jgi:probable HAF family extracellular repeat protein
VVGVSATGDGQQRAFLWRNGTMTDLGVLAGGASSDARAINRSGDVVGSSASGDAPVHAVLWSQGVMSDLGTLDGFGQSGANSINDVGQVVGYSDDAETGNSHAAL